MQLFPTIISLCLTCYHINEVVSFSNVKTSIKLGRLSRIMPAEIVHSCPNQVYCQGDLLDTVQKQKLFEDSKTFVDMSQKQDESVTLQNFKTMMSSTNNTPSKDQIKTFVYDNFEIVDESENWTPEDFNPTPSFLNNIRNSEIKEFAKSLVSLWPLLGRRIKDTVKQYPNRHSLIPVEEGFIVPGGRFREIYYWDSYWIIKGLLISEMTKTVKGMLSNFIYLIKQYGFIPNGSRIYYMNRSQPPLFTLMVGIYLEYTNDLAWLESNIAYIEEELNFWLSNRTLPMYYEDDIYLLAHYGTDSNTPRPESYAEDLETCSYSTDDTDLHLCYSALKTAAETGWDFSTRWIFDENGGTNANLSKIDSQRVIPVDLNAFLCKSFQLLSEFYGKLGNTTKQKEWDSKASSWKKAMYQFLYYEDDGIWYDYDYNLNKQRKYFFASNFAPLWADCYDSFDKVKHGEKAVEYYKKNNIDEYAGGVPTSLHQSGEQWDLPNAWPPLQEFVVLGLYKTDYTEAQKIAAEISQKWLYSNMKGFNNSGAMYEKYDAITPGQYGGGGEYEVQLGFGWSNGVALSLIDQFNSATTTFIANSCVLIGLGFLWIFGHLF
ncbi:hypothetical protein ABEB36_008119 [Hypothenemus hampei]|uniref:Trehalase n=1 Tax=Hypothenemus hampei TaxID=57062 RepID=A0AAU8BTR1_HYPHA